MISMTQDQLKKLIHYDKWTGIFVWIGSTSDKPINGKSAGCIKTDKYGYKQHIISIKNKEYVASRLAWLYETGEWPKQEIDHINRNSINNCWFNLRDISSRENKLNRNTQLNNTSGIPGVHFATRDNVWIAVRKSYGVTKHLLSTKDFFEACCARKSAEK